jgi:hypothetical protein
MLRNEEQRYSPVVEAYNHALCAELRPKVAVAYSAYRDVRDPLGLGGAEPLPACVPEGAAPV